MRAPCSGFCFALVVAVVAACGPTDRPNSDDAMPPEVDAPVEPCVVTAEVCGDGADNDCDLRIDCGDVDCSGVGSCPVCGAVNNPESQPLALPDGTSQSTPCATDSDCTNPAAPNCVQAECHASYTSTLNFVGFPKGGRLADVNTLLSVCVKMEHSWLRDLQIDLIAPDTRVITLHNFVARTGGEIFLGEANDSDSAGSPIPGVGYRYCWTPGASTIMLDSPTVPIGGDQVLPAGDYASASPWSSMAGAPLNGAWTMRVTDLWSADNGFMFEWSIAFAPMLVEDCSGPIIL